MTRSDAGERAGLSFVVCCHNSSGRLERTLRHLAAQDFAGVPGWEVLVIDNASTDATGAVAVSSWRGAGGEACRLRVVGEARLGVAHARYTGIVEAAYGCVCFVDDDNWVARDYARVAYAFMSHHHDVAACGSLNEVATDAAVPDWFEAFRRSYAVGPQSDDAGDVTQRRGVLWSAGMVLRRAAVLELLAAGFEPLVTGAQGEARLLRSEDYELCLALRLRGWKLWYLEDLRLQHYMPRERLSWQYLRDLLAGVGMSDPGLYPYYVAGELRHRQACRIWSRYVMRNVLEVAKRPVVFLLHPFFLFEGSAGVLQMVRALGCLRVLLWERRRCLEAFSRLRQARWIVPQAPPRGGAGGIDEPS